MLHGIENVHRPPQKVKEPKEPKIPVEYEPLRPERMPIPSEIPRDMAPKIFKLPKIKREKPSYPQAPVAQAELYSGTIGTGSRYCNSS
jgi:hypothetical protein